MTASHTTGYIAAEYVRMSTDQQRYSIDNQRAAIADYAAKHAMPIVRSYADAGRSGLTADRRPALLELMRDCQAADRPFNIVLVYDVSRWGRFQDTDESAFYEHQMRRAGVVVAYCTEPFENDGSPVSTIVKSVKRAMAAEYSRELSAKVAAGQRRMAERGFRVGSHAGYGLRRMIVDASGARRAVLGQGERKCVSEDRTILVPGPDEEVAAVRRIFLLYVQSRFGPKRIARQLADEGVSAWPRQTWSRSVVDRILTNEKYTGVNIFGKQSCRLRGKRALNPPETWVRVENAFEPLVTRSIFDAAQGLRAVRKSRLTDEAVLSGLRRLYRRHGRITRAMVSHDPALPSVSFIRDRFGSFARARELAAQH